MKLKDEIRLQMAQFGKEISETAGDVHRYCAGRKALRWFAAVWIVICYGVRMTQWEIFVDSDIMLQAPEELMYSWYGSQRFGLILTEKLFSFMRLLPQFKWILTAMALWCLVLFLSYCFHVWVDRTAGKYAEYVLVAVFLSSPVLAEQFQFILQAFEVALAMCFCAAAAFCAERAVVSGKSRCWYLVSLGFMVWAFGSYQALTAFYIALVLISYIGAAVCGDARCGLREGLFHTAHFLIGFAVSRFLGRALCVWQQADPTYVDSMFNWGRQSLEQSLNCLAAEVQRVYLAQWRTFFHPFFSGRR